jgi:hypothetical protein
MWVYVISFFIIFYIFATTLPYKIANTNYEIRLKLSEFNFNISNLLIKELNELFRNKMERIVVEIHYDDKVEKIVRYMSIDDVFTTFKLLEEPNCNKICLSSKYNYVIINRNMLS